MNGSSSTAQWRQETEEIIIGACMLEKGAYSQVMDILSPQTFKGNTVVETVAGIRITHGHLWSAIEKTYRTMPVDLVTVTKTLISDYGVYVPLVMALSNMTERVATSANIQTHSILLVEYSIREIALEMIDGWILETNSQRYDDLTGLIGEIANQKVDIINGIEVGIQFLSTHGYEEESEELRYLLSTISDKISRVKKRQYATHITNQYNALNRNNDD